MAAWGSTRKASRCCSRHSKGGAATGGAEHRETLTTTQNLATLYRMQGKYAQADALLTTLIETQSRVLGDEHPDTLATTRNMAELKRSQGQAAEAEPLLTRVADIRHRALGAEHPNTIDTFRSLGALLVEQKKYAPAEARSRPALAAYERANSDAWQRYHTAAVLGASLAGQKRFAEAEPLLVSGHRGMVDRQSGAPNALRNELTAARESLVGMYQAWGKREQAEEWRRTSTAP